MERVDSFHGLSPSDPGRTQSARGRVSVLTKGSRNLPFSKTSAPSGSRHLEDISGTAQEDDLPPRATTSTSIPKLTKEYKDYKAPNFSLRTSDPGNLMQIIREYEAIISNKDQNLHAIKQQLSTLELDQTQVLITLRQKLEADRQAERERWTAEKAELVAEHSRILDERDKMIRGLQDQVRQTAKEKDERILEQQKLLQGLHA